MGAKAKKKAEKKGKWVQKTIYFDTDVWEALEAHMTRERINSVSIAANDAVRYSLFPEHRSDREGDLVKQFGQLSFSLAEHRKKTGRDMTILQEMMLLFIKHYYMHTHQIPEKEKKAVEAQAGARLDAFMEELVRRLPESRPMSDNEERA